MTVSSKLVEEIVQIVMRDLNAPQADEIPAPRSTTSVLRLPHRVITENVLAAKSTVGCKITVAAEAVITPSGKDYIRRHDIIVSSESTTPANNSPDGVVLVVGDTKGISAPAVSAGWTVLGATDNLDAASQAGQRHHDQLSVCCSAQPSVIACLINRNTQRRAAVIDSHTSLSELFQEMNPDIVCLSATGWSFAELLKMLKQFSQKCHDVPFNWKELA